MLQGKAPLRLGVYIALVSVALLLGCDRSAFTRCHADNVNYPADIDAIVWRGRTYEAPTTHVADSDNVAPSLTLEQRKSIEEDEGRELGVVRELKQGWLVGTDYGEFGGSLFFVDRNGRRTNLVGNSVGGDQEDFLNKRDRSVGNVITLLDFGGELVAITGLAHLILDEGQVWRVTTVTDIPRVKKIADLPGQPQAMIVLPDAILIATEDKDVALRPGGKQEAAQSVRICRPPRWKSKQPATLGRA